MPECCKMKNISVGIILCVYILTTKGSALCGHEDKSCAEQLWSNGSEIPEACRMTYYKLNSAECASLNFQYKADPNDKVNDVRLHAYVSAKYRQTLLNVIFGNITWKRIMMRFSKMGSETEKNMCRTFEIWENVTIASSSSLVYDCPWSREDYEGEEYSFEYEYSSPEVMYTKFIFKVPFFKYFGGMTTPKSLQTFCYLDVTHSEYLKLHIQIAAPKYNISSYLIEVIRERSNISMRLTVQILDIKEAVNGELIFPYPTWNEFGYFYFTVSPISDVCKEDMCMKTFTPKVFMGRKKSSLVIGIVGASVILFALFYAMFFWNRQKNNKECNPPRLLLVYNASVNAHCIVVRHLAQLLSDVLRLEVLLDVYDIPRTNHKDPLVWCSHAFSYATHIIYIASPEVSMAKSNTDNIYKIDGVAMKYIRRELACTYSTKQIIVVTFPYSVKNIPPELNNLKKFDLMKDMDGFVSSLIMPPYQSWTFLQIYRPNRLRGEPLYLDLVASAQSAQKEVEVLSKYIGVPNSETPSITVTGNSMEDVAATDDPREDEKRLLKVEDNFSFRISSLDLSGSNSSNQPITTPTGNFSTNIQSLPL